MAEPCRSERNGLGGVVRAELLKLRKRPATWILAGLALYFMVFFYYFFPYGNYRLAKIGAIILTVTFHFQLAQVLPDRLIEVVMNAIGGYDSYIAVIFGALVAGNEYGWGTLKTILTQRPSRSTIYIGQTLAVGIIVALIVLATWIVAAVISVGIALTEGAAITWEPWRDIVLAFGAGWMILALWAAVGMMLATLYRSSAVAIGVGLLWVVLIEGQIIGLLSQAFVWLNAIQEWLPWSNTYTLSGYWGTPDNPNNTNVLWPVSGHQFFWLPAVYLVVAVLLGILVFRRRDVT